MRLLELILAVALPLLGVSSAAAENISVQGAEGVRLSAMVDLPPGEGRFPAVVLAPGQGYHMTLPAMEATARALTAQGIAVFRFNWAYFTAEPKGKPSPDLSRELDDLKAVVSAARAHPRVLAQSVSVGGKSLGSVVAWRAFVADRQLVRALLLTPLCSRIREGERVLRFDAADNYPGFESERRPSLWVTGDHDPLCSPPVLYRFAATTPQAARIAIVGGDHGYEDRALPQARAELALHRNLTAVSAVSAAFLAETVEAETTAAGLPSEQ